MSIDLIGASSQRLQPSTAPAAVRQPALQGLGARLAPAGAIDRSSELYQQCQEFESLFVQMMLKEMRATVEQGEIMNGGYAEDIFEDMLYQERAKEMTRASSFGLADTIYRQLAGTNQRLPVVEAAPTTPPPTAAF